MTKQHCKFYRNSGCVNHSIEWMVFTLTVLTMATRLSQQIKQRWTAPFQPTYSVSPLYSGCLDLRFQSTSQVSLCSFPHPFRFFIQMLRCDFGISKAYFTVCGSVMLEVFLWSLGCIIMMLNSATTILWNMINISADWKSRYCLIVVCVSILYIYSPGAPLRAQAALML